MAALAVAASFVVVEAVQEPELMLTFVGLAGPPGVPPPAPPKGSPRPANVPEPEKPKPANNETVQPVAVERITREDLERQIEDAGDTVEGSPFGVEGGVEGAPDGGVPGIPFNGLLGNGWGGGGEAPAAPEEPRYVTPEMTPPVLVHRVEPDYPEAARRARIEGKVILRAVIAESGAVQSVQVLRSVPLLEEAAVEAVQKWRYTPARLDGEPLRVYLTVVVTFQLQ